MRGTKTFQLKEDKKMEELKGYLQKMVKNIDELISLALLEGNESVAAFEIGRKHMCELALLHLDAASK
jgi:hypothetical protein